MHRLIVSLVLVALVVVCAPAWAADNPVVGVWKLTTSGAEGHTWTLTVKEENGKLSGTLAGDLGGFELIDPKLDGQTFTFKVSIDEKIYAAESKISGKTIEGTYKGPEDEGTFKGEKQP